MCMLLNGREASVVLKRIGGDHGDTFDRDLTLTSKDSTIVCGRTSSKKHSSVKAAKTNAFFNNPVISRSHAQFSLGPDLKVNIEDIGSTHGTFLNQQLLTKHKPVPLNSGDIIRLGAYIERGKSTFAPYEMSAHITYSPTGPRTHSQNAPFTIRVPDDTEVEEISDDEDNGIWDGEKVLTENDFRPLRETIDLTDAVVSTTSHKPAAQALSSTVDESDSNLAEPQTVDLVDEDPFETTLPHEDEEDDHQDPVICEAYDDEEGIEAPYLGNNDAVPYGYSEDGEEHDYGGEEDEEEDGDHDLDDYDDEEDDFLAHTPRFEDPFESDSEKEDEIESVYGEKYDQHRTTLYETLFDCQSQVPRDVQSKGSTHHYPQFPTLLSQTSVPRAIPVVLNPGSFAKESHAPSNSQNQARFPPLEHGSSFGQPFFQGIDHLAAASPTAYHMPPMIGRGNPLVESGNKFLNRPHDNFPHFDAPQAPSPKLDSAFQFEQSKGAPWETKEPVGVSSRLSIASLVETKSKEDSLLQPNGESLPQSSGEPLSQPELHLLPPSPGAASPQAKASKRKADDISESSPEEEVAVASIEIDESVETEQAEVTEVSEVAEPTSAPEVEIDNDKEPLPTSAASEGDKEDQPASVKSDLMRHEVGGSPASNKALPAPVARQPDLPQPAKRMRRTIEALSCALAGSVAAYSVLVASAPAL